MANNYKSFPVRSTTGYPSPSGGFYSKFPQKLKSLSLEQKADVSSTLMILENGLQKSSDRLRPPSAATESETWRVNRVFISHRFKSAEFAESIKAPQSLQSSFQIKKPVILKGNQRNVATQVEEEPNLRLEFTDMKEYRNWTADNVDPYIKVSFDRTIVSLNSKLIKRSSLLEHEESDLG